MEIYTEELGMAHVACFLTRIVGNRVSVVLDKQHTNQVEKERAGAPSYLGLCSDFFHHFDRQL